MLCGHWRCGLVKRVLGGRSVSLHTQALWTNGLHICAYAPIVDDAVERVAVGREGDVAPRVHGPGQARQPEAEAHYSCAFGAVLVWSGGVAAGRLRLWAAVWWGWRCV